MDSPNYRISIQGLNNTISAIERFAPDLKKQLDKEVKGILSKMVTEARGNIPFDIHPSGWARQNNNANLVGPLQQGQSRGLFVRFDAAKAKAGITAVTPTSKSSATGFMMIKREVFTAIMDKNPQLKYKPDLRTGIENSQNAFDFFPVGIYREKDGVNRFLSEDYYFCRLWEECGGEIWTDVTTPITHLGSTEYHGSFIEQLNKK